MVRRMAMRLGFVALLVSALAACGQTGKLYLPDAPGDIVTRPASPPPASENSEAPPPTPEGEDAKKDKSAAPPPPTPK